MSSFKSKILVVTQLMIIFFFMWRGSIFRMTPLFLSVNAIAIFFGVWSLWTMRKHLNVFPELRDDAKLLTKGPYGLTRNPMYFALLICLLPAALVPVDIILIAVYVVLIFILRSKIMIEEKELEKRFPEFQDYKSRVSRLIPWVC